MKTRVMASANAFRLGSTYARLIVFQAETFALLINNGYHSEQPSDVDGDYLSVSRIHLPLPETVYRLRA
jgi:hypothetical protein